MKICTKCHLEKLLEDFPNAKQRKDGKNSWCRACVVKHVAAWRLANPEHAKRLREQERQTPAYKIRLAQWQENHQKETKQRLHQYYLENRELYRTRVKNYRAEHPGFHTVSNRTRRARKTNAPLNNFTYAQWVEMLIAYDHRCVYCGQKMKRLTQDHLTPLVKGGSHTASNIVPACHSCNSKKGAGAVLIPVQPLLLTIAPPKKPLL